MLRLVAIRWAYDQHRSVGLQNRKCFAAGSLRDAVGALAVTSTSLSRAQTGPNLSHQGRTLQADFFIRSDETDTSATFTSNRRTLQANKAQMEKPGTKPFQKQQHATTQKKKTADATKENTLTSVLPHIF